MDAELLTKVGGQLFETKLLLVSVQCLWIYDYLLTLEDEIEYAWSGRKSWVFALFIANRYTPVVHILWSYVTMFHYKKSVCEGSKWIPTLHTGLTAFFAQTAVALRIYAITRKNKVIGGILAFLIAVGFCHDIFSTVWMGLGPLQPLPDVNLDIFNICVRSLWMAGQLVYYSLSMTFDVVAFLIILFSTRRPRMSRYPGMPSVLDTIVRDATYYFLLIFSLHILSFLFFFATPVDVQLTPGIANTFLTPIMASRLMLSLKKAAVEPKVLWSVETMSGPNSTVFFVPSVSGGAPTNPVILDEGAIELDTVP